MPPKVQDTHPQADQNHALEEETSRAARRIVATYAQDFLDGVTLMSMLGVEPKGLVHKKVLAEQADAARAQLHAFGDVDRGLAGHLGAQTSGVN